MTSLDVLSLYENVAGLTARMAHAAQAGDWDGLAELEGKCGAQAGAAQAGVPALGGEQRQRKLALLREIMANDRAIRAATDPWQARLDAMMGAAH